MKARLIWALWGLGLVGALGVGFYALLSTSQYHFHFESLLAYRSYLLKGYLLTLQLSCVSLFTSLLIGALFLGARRSGITPLVQFSMGAVALLRGTPLLVQVLVWYYIVLSGLGLDNPFLSGLLILSVFSGAYMTEILRGGIESIEPQQFESIRSLCFSTYQGYRYIIIPQVIRRILPALTSQLASLIKDSSLLSVIAIAELSRASQEVSGYTYATLEVYLVQALGYLSLTLPVIGIGKILEVKLRL